MSDGRPSEESPLVGKATLIPDVLSRLLPPFVWGCAVLAASAGMINLNKTLMQDNVFPHVLALMLLQFTFSTMLNGILLLTCPHLYTSFHGDNPVTMTRGLLHRRVFPVAVMSVVSIAASNWAYLYSTVPFLQMMKESNIITIYIFSLMLGMETFDVLQVSVLVTLVVATGFSIDGELAFSSRGMMLQGIGCLADAAKNIMSSLLLSGIGRLDPLSFSCLISPMVVVLVGFGIGLAEVSSELGSVQSDSLRVFELPPWERFAEHRHLLMLNAVGAFVLNLSIAMFMRHSSALSFGILGIIKDMLVVISSTILLGAPISRLQIFSFSAQIICASLWTCLKVMPKAETPKQKDKLSA